MLLPSGKLDGVAVFQSGESEGPEGFFDNRVPVTPRPTDAGGNILLDRHVGKQGVILEQIPHVPLLRRQVDLSLGIKQDFSVEDDAPLIGLLDARDAFQRHALAAAGGSEQSQNFIFRLKPYVQGEFPERLPPSSEIFAVCSGDSLAAN